MKTIITHLIHLLELPHGDLTVCYGKSCFKTIAKSSNEVGHGFRKYVQSRPIMTPMLLHRDVLMNIKSIYLSIYLSTYLSIYLSIYLYKNDVIRYFSFHVQRFPGALEPILRGWIWNDRS